MDSHNILEFKMVSSLDEKSILVGLIFAPGQEKAARIYLTVLNNKSEKNHKLGKPLLKMRPYVAPLLHDIISE